MDIVRKTFEERPEILCVRTVDVELEGLGIEVLYRLHNRFYLITTTELGKGDKFCRGTGAEWISGLYLFNVNTIVNDSGMLRSSLAEKQFAGTSAESTLVNDGVGEESMNEPHLQIVEWIQSTGWSSGMIHAIKSLDNLFSDKFGI